MGFGAGIRVACIAASVPFLLAGSPAEGDRARARADRERALEESFAREAEMLRWVETADALADADRAVAADDHRLYGVYRYSVIVPGAPDGTVSTRNRCGLKMIEGTSDFVNDRTVVLNAKAHAYAAAYNRRVLELTRCLG